MKVNEVCTIKNINSNNMFNKLLSYGFLPGQSIKLLNSTRLGVIVEILGTTVAIDNFIAQVIEVER